MPLALSPKFRAIPHMLAVGAALALGVLIILWAGTGRVSPREAVAVAMIAGAVAALGRVICTMLGLEQKAGIAVAGEIVIGGGALSLLVLGLSSFLNLNAVPAFAWSLVAVAAMVLLRGTASAPEPTSFRWVDLVVVLALGAGAALWFRTTANAMMVARLTGSYPAWPDYFAHASELQYLRDYGVFRGSTPNLEGAAQVFYHRGGYVLPAVFAGLGGRPTVEVASCVWAPLGILLMAVGAYGYGTVVAGRAGGAVGAFALLLVPDALWHGFGNRLFSFHWLIAVGPAAAYAIAIGFIACALLVLGHERSRLALSFWGGVLAFLAVFFKAQIAMPLLAAYGVSFFWIWKPSAWWLKPALVVILAVAGVTTCLQLEKVALAPHFFTGRYDTTGYLSYIHRTPSAYREWYLQLARGAGIAAENLLGVGFLLLTSVGFFLPLATVVSIIRQKRQEAGMADFLPWVLLGGYLMAMYCIPMPRNGDPGEYKHRPFVLIYAFFAVSAMAGLGALLWSARDHPNWRKVLIGLTAGGLLLGGAHVWREGRTAQYYDTYHGRELSPALIEAAIFIRSRAAPSDVVFSSDQDPEGAVVAMTERAGFLSRSPVFQALGGDFGATVSRRNELTANLASIKTIDQLRAFGRSEGVRWFLLRGGDYPAWNDDICREAAYVSTDWRVFDLR